MKTTVSQVMSSPAIVVPVGAPFKEVVETLQGQHIGALPVVDEEGRVAGVVSEGDLMLKEERGELEERRHLVPRRRGSTRAKAAGTTAAEVMTSPAITIRAEEGIALAAHILHERDVHHLPVVDDQGRPLGVVTRGDLLKVFMRPDEQIRAEVVRDLLQGTLWLETADVTVEVDAGVVHLTGNLPRKTDVRLVERLVPLVDGVVDVQTDLTYQFDDTRVQPEQSQPWAPPRR
jgi:CBS domain-containing protein